MLINKNPSSVTPVTIAFNGMGQSGPYRTFQFGAGVEFVPAGGGAGCSCSQLDVGAVSFAVLALAGLLRRRRRS